jgi:uncharacterized protein (DUF2147 family)
MKMIRPAFFILAIIFLSSFANNPDEELMGVWWNTERDAKIEIYRCGEVLCGKVVWLRNPKDDDGKPVKDENNVNSEMKKREVMGMKVLEGFSHNGKDRWVNGEAYDPKSGKTYTSYISLKDKNTLELRGYIGTPILGRTVLWKRDR